MNVVDVFQPAEGPLGGLLEAADAVPAGFPSPATDFFFGDLDLNEYLIRDKAATFIIRVSGDSMMTTIASGDRVIVDRSISPQHGHIIIAILDGELTVKRLIRTRQGVTLAADNPAYPDLQLSDWAEASCWGVVTWILHAAI